MGRWILEDILGTSGYRRVFFALNQLANIAAIKVVEWTSQNYYSVDKEIKIF